MAQQAYGGDVEALARTFLAEANAGSEPEQTWVKRIERYGVTDRLLADLNSDLWYFRGAAELRLDPDTRELTWAISIPPDLSVDRDMLVALEVGHFLASGIFDKLKRCKLAECRKYFIGKTDRADWCSNTCGSKYRVRKKRKLDKARGYT